MFGVQTRFRQLDVVRMILPLTVSTQHANQALSQAQGEAAIRIATGESDKTRMVQFVAAEANRFSSLLPEYRKNPALFRNLRQSEALQKIFANPQVDKFLVPRRDGQGMRIQLNREPEKLKTFETPKEPGH